MRALLQRVSRAQVSVGDRVVSRIGAGLLIFLGVERGDTATDADAMAAKISGLRLFDDERGRMNRSPAEVGAAVLVVSQFTLVADCRRGRRPSFDAAAPADEARDLYDAFVRALRATLPVQTGEFQAMMQVELVNDGPVTILLDSGTLQRRS